MKNISDDDVSNRSNAENNLDGVNYASNFSLKNDIENIKIGGSSNLNTNENLNSNVNGTNNDWNYPGNKIIVYNSIGQMEFDSIDVKGQIEQKLESDKFKEQGDNIETNIHLPEESKKNPFEQIPVNQCNYN